MYAEDALEDVLACKVASENYRMMNKYKMTNTVPDEIFRKMWHGGFFDKSLLAWLQSPTI